MNKNKLFNSYNLIVILVVIVIGNTILLLINNSKANEELKLYKDYYKSSEALFNEIEDYNENLFDSDKAIDYYKAKDAIKQTSHFK